MQPAEMTQILAWDTDLPRYQGAVYRLRQPNGEMKARYENILKQRAMEECIAASKNLPDKEKEYNRRLILADLRNGLYRWGGPHWSEAMKSDYGMLLLIKLMLYKADNQKEVSEEQLLAMMNDDEFAPWLLASVYVVCGMDPTMALAMGKATVAEARKEKQKNQSQLSQITDSLLDHSSKSILNSGTSSAS